MSGVFGWTGVPSADPSATLAKMIAQVQLGGTESCSSALGDGFALAASGLGRTAALIKRGSVQLTLHGHPSWGDAGRGQAEVAVVGERFLDAYESRGTAALLALRGDFALAIVDPVRERALIAVDRMGVRNIVYAPAAGGLIFGPTCDIVACHSQAKRTVDPQAIYNYLYFHMVPGPRTVFREIQRVPPGHFVELAAGKIEVREYWRMHFVEEREADFATLKTCFRGALRQAVSAYVPAEACGAFLSGGTDSSTISGLLGQVLGQPAPTYSIGFDAEGFDEMQYARLAAKHFGTAQHEYYVTPQDVVDAVPSIARAYDQPFGNASAVPTYYCARLAQRDGMTRILGGDGGDELFGGNARYAKQWQLAHYSRVPAPLRRHMIEPLVQHLPLTGSLPLLRKAKSYVEQAALPMPERYESYNLLERLGPQNVFTADFLAQVDRGAPLALMRKVYDDADAQSLINCMLALDFQFTLTDNDLPKVTRMCELAGVDVAFPMLHDEVVEFSAILPPKDKLRGTKLRHFFKEALRDFLPAEIIAKEKHGFGLPVGAWLQQTAALRELASDSLNDMKRRAIVRDEFIDRLLSEHVTTHAGYFGTMVWVLMMLELWFQGHTGAR